MSDPNPNPNPNPEIPIPPIRTKPKPNPTTTTTTTTTTTPRVTISTPTPTASGSGVDTPTSGAERKIAIAVDFSNESSYAVHWAVHHYLRPRDAVILLHVQPTSVLYGADWGSLDFHLDHFLTDTNYNNNNNNDDEDEDCQKKLEHHFDAFTSSKASDLAQPLIDAHVPYKIHIVKDHDMRERLCLEVERLGLHAVIMGSRGFGATKRGSDGRLGSVSDYCVRHCVCPVVVVRYPGDNNGDGDDTAMVSVAEIDEEGAIEEDEEYHDVPDEQKATA